MKHVTNNWRSRWLSKLSYFRAMRVDADGCGFGFLARRALFILLVVCFQTFFLIGEMMSRFNMVTGFKCKNMARDLDVYCGIISICQWISSYH